MSATDADVEGVNVFARPAAALLLREHLRGMQAAQRESNFWLGTSGLVTTDVAAAFGDENESVAQLLPTFEHMLRYKYAVRYAKGDGHESQSRWQFIAERLLEGEKGRLPGQLYEHQPVFLPLRIAAPPRVGKSAAALLVASLARRCGFKIFYSVAPNKIAPLGELEGKLARLRWRSPVTNFGIDSPTDVTLYKASLAAAQCRR